MGDVVDPADGGLNPSSRPDSEKARPVRARMAGPKLVLAFSAVAFIGLGAAAGWLGYRIHEDRQVLTEQEQLVAGARQGAINLATISHATVDADIQRILDTSTGVFHDDFRQRSEPFAEVVKQAQSTSEGTVTSTALESHEGDSAQVLVVVSVKMSNPGGAEQVPDIWRMRVKVEQDGDMAKLSDVQFVS